MSKIDKILIINNSDLLNTYLKDMLRKHNIDVTISKTAFDGVIKMKNEVPDIIIIDYQLTLDEKMNFFAEKKDYKTVADIPVICLSSKIDMDAVITAGKNKVFKFFEKPVKQDLLLKAIGEVLKKDFEYDDTPSIIEVSINNDILFIEIGLGINIEKVDTLRYKILELMKIYKLTRVKTLVMFNDVKRSSLDLAKIKTLAETIIESTNSRYEMVKILSADKEIKSIISKFENINRIEVLDDLSKAMDALGSINLEYLVSSEKTTGKEELAIDNNDIKLYHSRKPLVSIIDDDDFILDLVEASLAPLDVTIHKYTNGNIFLKAVNDNENPDLVFLDIMMPEISGFEVLDQLKKSGLTFPVIIFSALSQKDTVKKAMQYGIKRYIVKPIDPETILKKAHEILQSEF